MNASRRWSPARRTLRMKVAGPFKIRPYLPRFILDSSRWYLCAREMRVPLVSVWRLGSRVLSASCVVGASAQRPGACLVPRRSCLVDKKPLNGSRDSAPRNTCALSCTPRPRPARHRTARTGRTRESASSRCQGWGLRGCMDASQLGGGVRFRTKRHDIALRMIPYRPCGHRSCDIVHREEIAGMKTAISHTERK